MRTCKGLLILNSHSMHKEPAERVIYDLIPQKFITVFDEHTKTREFIETWLVACCNRDVVHFDFRYVIYAN